MHQRAVGVLYRALDDYLAVHRFATAMTSPADLDLRAEQVVQPDVFVAEGIGDREWTAVGIPLLVVEVLSPSRESIDRDVTERGLQDRRRRGCGDGAAEEELQMRCAGMGLERDEAGRR